MRQTLHVLITTYTEPAALVRECVTRLLVAPEPLYCEKIVYVCDDGHAKPEGAEKQKMVAQLQYMGHTNVRYVGDRVKRPGQLNGKSANVNNAVLNHIFPGARSAADVPARHILLIMDCDHMAKPDFFYKLAPCMLDEAVGIALAPQYFHNHVTPDCLDICHAEGIIVKQPYRYGAGMCHLTGTNCMIRAKAAFLCARRFEPSEEDLEEGVERIEILAEDEVTEDFEIGLRIHAAGYKSTFVNEKVAAGEVPLPPRLFWRQRLRWSKGGHLFVLAPDSLLRNPQPHVSLYQKALYFSYPIRDLTAMIAMPVLFALPFACLVMNTCPYGMDRLLFGTHVAQVCLAFVCAVYYPEVESVKSAICDKIGTRVLWFTSVKACINILMVHTGWKDPGFFKYTPKSSEPEWVEASDGSVALPLPPDVSSDPPRLKTHDKGSSSIGSNQAKLDRGMPSSCSMDPEGVAEPPRGGGPVGLATIHTALSRVTEMRRRVMPLGGTLDIWVLLGITAVDVAAVVVGLKGLKAESLQQWDEAGMVKMIGIVYAIFGAVPGILFIGYAAVYDRAPRLFQVWVSAVLVVAMSVVVLIEGRIAHGYATGM